MLESYLKRRAGFLLALLLCVPSAVSAQYFGRNKVQYRAFEFQILRTDHFDLYYYPEEAEAAAIVSRMAERWHARLSRFFGHDLRGRQPLILYAVAAHFRQTNAIEGLIGEGTGGVTEALKRRIVLPMSGSLADTDHVLGHELVHAFQFDMTGTDVRDPSEGVPGILAFPLWFVEGMAEYLSLGPIDAQTAMWLRDAAVRERLPRVADLNDPKYFPYRWGHAFWAYIGARYGDRTVASLIRSAANPQSDLVGLARQLGTDPDTLTADWHAAIRLTTQAVADAQPPISSRARLAVAREHGGGRYNVGPEVSPDGRRFAFFSERDRFSVELFLADADTGRVVRKLLKTASDPHFDSLEFLSSAGTWSPDGRTLAITAVRSGRPVLVFIDPDNARIRRELPLAGLDDALNPAFSPDGRSVVVSGNVGGLIDLYVLSIDSGRLDRLTSDPFADLEPAFTPDGRAVVFSTERYTTNLTTLEPGSLRLATVDLATKTVRPIAGFLKGKHISPQVSADGRAVTFIADPDGISNLYRMPIDGGPIERLSSQFTGVAGITSGSPALSVATRTGRLVFSVFEDDGHAIYVQDPADTVALVPPDVGETAAILPGRSTPTGDVQRLLTEYARGLPPADLPADSEPYKQGLSLDAMGQPTVSAGVGQYGGGYVNGGLSAFFSDMLGDRGLGLSAEVAGNIRDFGGQFVYINRRHRWNWAASVEVSPYRVGYILRTDRPETNEMVFTEVIERQPSRGAFGSAAFPFNTSTRLELGGGARSLSFSRQTRTAVVDAISREVIERFEENTKLGETLYLAQGSVALVHDSSFFGVTSPLYGLRYRVELAQTAGSLKFSTWLLDGRRYFMPKRPVTIAVRALHYGRYGRDGEDPQLLNLYLGTPEFVRGYGVGSFSGAECLKGASGAECDVFRSLMGSRMVVGNFEVRAPLVGLFTGELEYGRLPIEVAAFADAGLTWSSTDRWSLSDWSRPMVRSVGGAVRANLLGIFAVELSVARPLDRPDRSLQWQLGIKQGF